MAVGIEEEQKVFEVDWVGEVEGINYILLLLFSLAFDLMLVGKENGCKIWGSYSHCQVSWGGEIGWVGYSCHSHLLAKFDRSIRLMSLSLSES